MRPTDGIRTFIAACGGIGLAASLAIPPAMAQDILTGSTVTETVEVLTGDGPIRVEVNRSICARVARHVPAADVAFQPGVDVDGDAVAPADLGAGEIGGGGRIDPPETLRFPVRIAVGDELDPLGDTGFDSPLTVGEVEIAADGTVFFDGAPLQSEEERLLQAACQLFEAR